MQYSLLSRFRGTLLGAAVGEALAYSSGQSTLGWQDLGQGPRLGLPQNESAPLSQLVRLQAETLIDGGLDLKYWARRDATSPGLLPAQVIAGTLPVILFFHEDEAKLGQKVAQTTRLWQAPTALRYGTLALAYAIAQALGERLDPATLIAQTAAYLRQLSCQQDRDDPELLTLLVLLEQVQVHLAQGSGLETTLAQLLKLPAPAKSLSVAIALAFYCFLSTPEDYRLAVTRAVRAAHQPQLTALVAAVLSGAHNSSAGVPPGWRVSLSQWLSAPVPSQQPTAETIVPLADQLMAAWSGIYEPTDSRLDPDQGPAVAAPGILRPR